MDRKIGGKGCEFGSRDIDATGDFRSRCKGADSGREIESIRSCGKDVENGGNGDLGGKLEIL